MTEMEKKRNNFRLIQGLGAKLSFMN